MQILNIMDRNGIKDHGYIFDIKRYAIHDGPGIRTTVFFKGCPLRCQWCHNPEGIKTTLDIQYRQDKCSGCGECISYCPEKAISVYQGNRYVNSDKCKICGTCVENCAFEALEKVGNKITVTELIKEIEKDIIFFDESGGGVTFSGGEPMFQPFFLNELLTRCIEMDIHTVVDTSGYCSYNNFELINDKVHLFLYDLKLIDEKTHMRYAGVPNTLIQENLKKLINKRNNVVIRIPVIPGINNNKRNINKLAELLGDVDKIPDIHLLPYHTGGKEKFQRMEENSFIIEDFPENGYSVENIKKLLEKDGFYVKIGG